MVITKIQKRAVKLTTVLFCFYYSEGSKKLLYTGKNNNFGINQLGKYYFP